MPELPAMLSPLGLLLWYIWNFAVLASIQLTVRLIRAFSIRTTALGALALTLGTIPVVLLYAFVLGSAFAWYPLTMLLAGAVGFLVAHSVLHLRRLRGRVAAAFGCALLSGPWPVFFERLPRW